MFEGIKRKIKEWEIKHDRFDRYILILLGMSLLSLLIIGRYNVMAADDYAMGKHVQHIWESITSIPQVLHYAVTHALVSYKTWQGCFTVNFWDSLNPGFWTEQLTWLTPILMLGMVLLSTYWFVKATLKKYYDIGKRELLFLWGVIVFLLLETLPSPVEALYWYAGAIAYTFLHYSMLLLFVFLLGSERLIKGRNKVMVGIVIALYAFLIGGCQYGTVLQCLLWYVVYLLVERKRLSWHKLLPFFMLFAGFGINLMSPGNRTRQSETMGLPPIKAIISSFMNSFHYIRIWFSPLLIVCLLAALPVIWQIVKNKRAKDFTYPLPLLISAGSYCLFAAAFTPSLYGVGNVDAGRLQNQIQSIFYAMLWMNAFYWTGWMQNRVQKAGTEFWQDCSAVKNILKKYLWAYRWLTFAGILLVIVGTADKNTFSSMSALRSLLNGEAQAYYEQAQERLVLYQDESVSIVEIEPFRVKPRVLFFTDIVEEGNANYWINENIAEYYDKEKILLMEKGE
ncbi:MAG: hypothetical protein J1E65_05515 [Lachnospiraceae bacterium]|nr:hypothetical protein [Lachnospiraceae bacterium]